jgi:hypothetical protein
LRLHLTCQLPEIEMQPRPVELQHCGQQLGFKELSHASSE